MDEEMEWRYEISGVTREGKREREILLPVRGDSGRDMLYYI